MYVWLSVGKLFVYALDTCSTFLSQFLALWKSPADPTCQNNSLSFTHTHTLHMLCLSNLDKTHNFIHFCDQYSLILHTLSHSLLSRSNPRPPFLRRGVFPHGIFLTVFVRMLSCTCCVSVCCKAAHAVTVYECVAAYWRSISPNH